MAASEGHRGSHSDPFEPVAAAIRSRGVPRPESCRAMHRMAQALPPTRNPIRQTGVQLSRLRQDGHDPTLPTTSRSVKQDLEPPPFPRIPATALPGDKRRGNATHLSSTDPEARLYRKGGTDAYLLHSMHATTENRHGLVMAVAISEANGTSERECALKMVKQVRRCHRIKVATLVADAGYEEEVFLLALEGPHVALRKPGFGRSVEGGEARAAMRQRQRLVGYLRSH